MQGADTEKEIRTALTKFAADIQEPPRGDADTWENDDVDERVQRAQAKRAACLNEARIAQDENAAARL